LLTCCALHGNFCFPGKAISMPRAGMPCLTVSVSERLALAVLLASLRLTAEAGFFATTILFPTIPTLFPVFQLLFRIQAISMFCQHILLQKCPCYSTCTTSETILTSHVKEVPTQDRSNITKFHWTFPCPAARCQ